MLRKIKLYGELAKFVGHKELEADFKSIGECGRFLIANWPALEGHLKNKFYHVFVEENNVGEEEINHFSNGTVKIVPAIQGAKKAWKVVAGIAIIGLAAWATGGLSIGAFSLGSKGLTLGATGFAAAAGAGAWAGVAALAANVGALLIISGISELLADDEKLEDTDPMNNFNFSNIAQIARAGAAIPVVYGEIVVGSVVISQSVEVNNSQILTTA